MSACSMFGVLISGRLVQTDFVAVDESKVVCNVPDADNINHVVVFMTGAMPFPEGFGGAVYFSWPTEGGPAWYLLGFLTNEKPSAIFKVAGLKRNETTGVFHPFGQLTNHQSHMMQIGISVETLCAISQLTPAIDCNTRSVDSYREFCVQMVQNCFNYVTSFAVTRANMLPGPMNEEFVPLLQLRGWYESFERRFAQNPYFWKS